MTPTTTSDIPRDAIVIDVVIEPRDDWPASGLAPIHEVAAQIRDAGSLRPTTWVRVRSVAKPRKLVERLLGGPPRGRAHVAVRCTALLVRGFVDVRTDAEGNAYGRVPTPV